MKSPTCPSCARAMAAGSRVCPSCGHSLDSDLHNVMTQAPSPGDSLPTQMPSHHPTLHEGPSRGRFVAGTLLAGRYRLVALVGKGGLGEVYRAEDLRVEQTVALKFLPESLADNPRALELLRSEVRLARQVSHPDVCRVYDMGEVDDLHFISMEYIDGENLASLLRRIGRLPEAKGLEIARHICSGLAAAHDRGIVHRDLKPANVMIDGRGNVRLTDFGLAGLGTAPGQSGPRMGTAEYMAPEQYLRGEATMRSDIYSLGLILYEMFTGHAAADGGRHRAQGTSGKPASLVPPRSLVPSLDPRIDRVILRCLEREPSRRPGSALAVAAALPGGDPLAAALAAGETPSPEIVAAAGQVGGLAPRVGWACVLLIAAGIAAVGALWGRVSLLPRIPFDKPPAVLEDRAREVLARLGHAGEAADTAHGFRTDGDYLDYLKSSASIQRWEALRSGAPPAVYFWYRQSPRHMRALDMRGRVSLSDPAPFTPGMASVRLDPRGHLIELHVVPPYIIDHAAPVDRPGWDLLFAEAGLELSEFEAVPPGHVPPVAGDTSYAWEGRLPGQPDAGVRVEAAAFRGRPVWFSITGPWSQRATLESVQIGTIDRLSNALFLALHMGILVACVLLVRGNLRSGRGDTKGATRAACFLGAALTLMWLLRASHVPSVGDEWILLMAGVGMALFVSALFWVLYMALEPYLRSRWPETMISWSRILAGGFRDPLVGRDVLIGGAFGVALVILRQARVIAPAAFGLPTDTPMMVWHEPLLGWSDWLGSFFEVLTKAFFAPVAYLFMIFLLRIIFRIPWVAIAACFVLITMINGVGGEPLILGLLMGGLTAAIILGVLLRFGLVALMSALFFYHMLTVYPITTDLAAWYASSTLFAVTICLTAAAAAFLTALGGRRAFEPPD